MNIEQVREYTLTLPGVTEDMPFGDDNVTFRVEGKIFLCLWLSTDQPRFALKLPPERNDELRLQYAEVTPAWHWNKKHWSDVGYEHVSDDLIQRLISESHALIVSKLPKAVRVKYDGQRHTSRGR